MNEYCFQIEDLTKKLFDDVGIVVKKI